MSDLLSHFLSSETSDKLKKDFSTAATNLDTSAKKLSAAGDAINNINIDGKVKIKKSDIQLSFVVEELFDTSQVAKQLANAIKEGIANIQISPTVNIAQINELSAAIEGLVTSTNSIVESTGAFTESIANFDSSKIEIDTTKIAETIGELKLVFTNLKTDLTTVLSEQLTNISTEIKSINIQTSGENTPKVKPKKEEPKGNEGGRGIPSPGADAVPPPTDLSAIITGINNTTESLGKICGKLEDIKVNTTGSWTSISNLLKIVGIGVAIISALAASLTFFGVGKEKRSTGGEKDGDSFAKKIREAGNELVAKLKALFDEAATKFSNLFANVKVVATEVKVDEKAQPVEVDLVGKVVNTNFEGLSDEQKTLKLLFGFQEDLIKKVTGTDGVVTKANEALKNESNHLKLMLDIEQANFDAKMAQLKQFVEGKITELKTLATSLKAGLAKGGGKGNGPTNDIISNSDGPSYDGQGNIISPIGRGESSGINTNGGEVSGITDSPANTGGAGSRGGVGGGSNGKIVTSNRLDRLNDELSSINMAGEAEESLGFPGDADIVVNTSKDVVVNGTQKEEAKEEEKGFLTLLLEKLGIPVTLLGAGVAAVALSLGLLGKYLFDIGKSFIALRTATKEEKEALKKGSENLSDFNVAVQIAKRSLLGVKDVVAEAKKVKNVPSNGANSSNSEDGPTYNERGLPITPSGPGELSGITTKSSEVSGTADGASGGGSRGGVGGGSNGKIVTSNRLQGLRAEYNRFLESYDGFSGLVSGSGTFSRIAEGEDEGDASVGGLSGINPENIDLSIFQELKECLNEIITTLEQAGASSSNFGNALSTQSGVLSTIDASLQSFQGGISSLTEIFTGLGSALNANNTAFGESKVNIDSTSQAFESASTSAEKMAASSTKTGTSLQKNSTNGVKSQKDLSKEVEKTSKKVEDQGKKVEETAKKQKGFSDALGSGLNVMSQVGSATTLLTGTLQQMTGATDDSQLGQFINTVGEIGGVVSSVAGTLQDSFLPLLEQSGGLFESNSKSIKDTAKNTAIADQANKQLNATKQIQSNVTKGNIIATSVEDEVTKKSAKSKSFATRAQQGLNAAMKANPIGFIIGLVIPLVTAIVSLASKSETLKRVFTGTFEAIKVALKTFGDFVLTALKIYFFPFIAAFKFITGGIKGFFKGGIKGAVKGATSAVVDAGKDTLNSAKKVGNDILTLNKRTQNGYKKGVDKFNKDLIAKQKKANKDLFDEVENHQKRKQKQDAESIKDEGERIKELVKLRDVELKAEEKAFEDKLELRVADGKISKEEADKLLAERKKITTELLEEYKKELEDDSQKKRNEANKKLNDEYLADKKEFNDRLGKLNEKSFEERKAIALKEVENEESFLKKRLEQMQKRKQITKEEFEQLTAEIEKGTAKMREKVLESFNQEAFDKAISDIRKGFERFKNEIVAQAANLTIDGSATIEAQIKINKKSQETAQKELDKFNEELNRVKGTDKEAEAEDNVNKATTNLLQLKLKELALGRQLRDQQTERNKLALQLDSSLTNDDGSLNIEGQKKSLLEDQENIKADIADIEKLLVKNGASKAEIEAATNKLLLDQLDIQSKLAQSNIDGFKKNRTDKEKEQKREPDNIGDDGKLKTDVQLGNNAKEQAEVNEAINAIDEEFKEADDKRKKELLAKKELYQNRLIELNDEETQLELKKYDEQKAAAEKDKQEQVNLIQEQINLLKAKLETKAGLNDEELAQLRQFQADKKAIEEEIVEDEKKAAKEITEARKKFTATLTSELNKGLKDSLGFEIPDLTKFFDFKGVFKKFDEDIKAAGEGSDKALQLQKEKAAAGVAVAAQSIQAVAQIASGAISQLTANADAEIAKIDEEIQTRKDVLNEEKDREAEGYANSVAIQENAIKKLEKQREKAQKKKQKLAKAQLALDTLMQASSIAVAIAQMYATEAIKGIPGLIAASVAAGALVVTFAVLKAKAAKEANKEGKYEGGYTGGGNPREESGHFTHKQEYVIPHKPTQKYRKNLLEGIHYGERAKVMEGVARIMSDYNIDADEVVPTRPTVEAKPNTAKIVADLSSSNHSLRRAEASRNAEARMVYEQRMLSELAAIKGNTGQTADNTGSTKAFVQQNGYTKLLEETNGSITETIIDYDINYEA